MLSRTFNLNPVSRITKEKHHLVNPKLYLPLYIGKGKSGCVLELDIEIPEGYGFLDDVPTIGDFYDMAEKGKKRFHLKEEVYQLSQLTTDKVKKRGGRGGICSGNSQGQVVTGSFISKWDLKYIRQMDSLIPDSVDRTTAHTLLRLASAIKRCGFITDDDGVVGYMREYYRDTLPMFVIKDVREHSTFNFVHFQNIL